MNRRSLLGSAGATAAAVTTVLPPLAAPAIAQTALPEIRWRMTSGFPRPLDILFGTAELLGKWVGEMTDGRFRIQVFPAGEIVPSLGAFEATQNGTIEASHVPNYWFFGRQAALAFETGVPMGLNARQQTAWVFHGGGLELIHEVLKPFNMISFPAGNTGTQMGGFFRKEIRTVEDLKGLKFRIAGLGGSVMQRLGCVAQQLAPGDIYPALERGTIDAAEFVGPYDDEKLGLVRVAPFYYFPGWWEPGSMLSLNINLDAWNKLPPTYQAVLRAVASQANVEMMARYDAWNAQAIRRMVAGGAQLRPFSREIMAAAWTESHKLYDELAASNPVFKKVYDNWRPFRDQTFQWFRVAEQSYDNFAFTAGQTVR
jgi:TRAP-type mannitol/chloroaromatic compound transport system substrate-binding protein